MGKAPNNLIVFELEGLATEGGHLKLGDLLAQLSALKRSLEMIATAGSPGAKSRIYYRVVDLSHSSPVRVVLEPVIQRGAKKSVGDKRNIIDFPGRKLLKEVKSIRSKALASEDIDSSSLEALRALAPSEKRGVSSAKLSISNSKVSLDQKFLTNIESLIEGEEMSIGSVEGKLEALNLHGEIPSFWIYPRIGAKKINCQFPKELKHEVISCLETDVRIYGEKFYRQKSNFPHSIKVESIEKMSGECVWEELRGLVPAISRKSLASVRDEW